MAPTSPASPSTALEGQLREMYGRAAYTHKTHQKMADGYIARYKLIKLVEIALSAATTTSLLVALFGKSEVATAVGAILSAILAGSALYFKGASLGEQAQLHTEVGAKLWGARGSPQPAGRPARWLPVEEVRQQRDRLNAELEDIYKAASRTNSKAYGEAQETLKNAEELFFTDEELNKMLPKQLRCNPGTTT